MNEKAEERERTVLIANAALSVAMVNFSTGDKVFFKFSLSSLLIFTNYV
jgi:hypothetical protein